MKYTKLRKEVIDETGCLLEAVVMSFIMDGAEIQRTESPVIPAFFIGKSLKLSEDDVNWAVNTLEENGWFTSEIVTLQNEDGTERNSVKWNLSEKAASKIHIRKKKPIGVDGSLIFRDGKFLANNPISEGDGIFEDNFEDVTQQVMQSLGGVYVD
jgi:hypothetical protein